MLNGIRVVDLTAHLAGPYCTWMLASLGADVIKVERPGEGDTSRLVGPWVDGESVYFGSVNRNKRSMTLNLKEPEGKEVLVRLIRTADVLIENFRPGVLARLGFDEDAVRRLNPRLVFASVSGFGQTGPLRDRPAYDVVVQAMSGMMSVTGPAGGGPTRVGTSIGDIGSSIFTAVGILAALVERQTTSLGRRLDVAMLDCQLTLLENAVARYLNSGELPRPLGTRHPSIVPFQGFSTSDGMVVVAVDGEVAWARFCRAVGLESLAADPRFASAEARLAHHEELEREFTAVFTRQPTGHWVDVLVRADIPCAPVQTVKAAIESEHAAARGMVEEVTSSRGARFRFVGLPIGDRGAARAAPALGEHTDEVLRDLGYTTDEIEHLRERGVV